VIVVADTSCLTTLIKADYIGLVWETFTRVVVPPAVWEELTVYHRVLPPEIHRMDLEDAPAERPPLSRLGRGEAESIWLAVALRADVLLCDDQRANQFARNLGVRTLGSVGLALWAKRQGRITSLRTALERLEQLGGLYLSEAVRAEALDEAGE
jgi:uncharacterized protein